MFKKKPNIKPLSPLKSSDRRRTADQIIANFSINVPVDTNADSEENSALTAGLTALRKSLLPENALSARFTTTAGPDLRQVSGTVYVGSHEGTGNQPKILWVKVGDRIFPTVYTLWHNPGIIPLLYTPLGVVEKLQGGADLMIPGLQRGPPFPKNATKGAIIAVASLEAPTVPMTVGTCEIDISSLQQVQGIRGQAVEIFHWVGDEIWSWSTSGNPGIEPPEYIEGWDEEKGVDTSLSAGTEVLGLDGDEEDGGLTLNTEQPDAENPHVLQGEDVPSSKDFINNFESKELNTKEVDQAFTNAFLYGIRHYITHNKDHHSYSLEFPLSQSKVMSLLVQPFLPTYTPARTASLQIKKTSWKNLKKFIKHLDKEKIIKSKDQGNEVVVLSIDFTNSEVESFVPYRLPKKDTPVSVGTAAPSSTEPSVNQKLKLVSLLRPKENVAYLFNATKADPRGFYTPSELKQILVAYIEAENLVSEKNKRLININPQIASSLLGSSPADNAALSTGTIPRDALAERLAIASSPFHVILRNNAEISELKPKAGSPPKIHIVIETRSGNKTVTKISGVEAYYIAPQPLADELRKTCAGSTSVDRLQGSSPKNPVMEVLVQGPQRDAVIRALEKRGVNRAWIEVADKTKGKKK